MNHGPPGNSPLRSIVAVLIGLAGAVFIWIATPYNNLVIGNSNFTDSYLPSIVLLGTLILTLGVNPLLRWLAPALTLTARQLAISLGVMLMACTLPSSGLLGGLPFSLARNSMDVNNDKALSEQYEKMRLFSPARPALFPDALGYHAATPAADGYINELQPGQSIPWHAWIGPLASWGTFLLFCWLMMIGLGMIVFPQWRNNERLAFPLLTVQQAMIETPEAGRLFAPLFRQWSFWVATAAVFIIYLLYGANQYYPDQVPVVPLKWDITTLFAEDPFRQMPGYIRFGRFYFLFVGLAFFMPTRISFSIWFFMIAYGTWRAFAQYAGVLNVISKTDDQRFGGVLAIAVGVLWIGRAHWVAVFRTLIRREPNSALDRFHRQAAWMFLIGLAGMFGWMMWLGVSVLWALALVGFAFVAALLISRFVCEIGIPIAYLADNPLDLVKLAPTSWLTPVTLFATVVIHFLFSIASRVSPAAVTTQALGLDEQAKPSQWSGIALTGLGTLAVGLIVAGAANLTISYHHSTTLNGQSINDARQSKLADANTAIGDLSRGQFSKPTYNQYAHYTFGAALAGGLYYLCMTIPRWPLHPFGLLLVDSIGHPIWASVFVGWLVQFLVVRFGGARLYRIARPFFIGLIVGEVASAVFWAIVPLFLIAMHKHYIPVTIMPG